MRNRLVHAYYDINLDIVWNTVQEDLAPLIERGGHPQGAPLRDFLSGVEVTD